MTAASSASRTHGQEEPGGGNGRLCARCSFFLVFLSLSPPLFFFFFACFCHSWRAKQIQTHKPFLCSASQPNVPAASRASHEFPLSAHVHCAPTERCICASSICARRCACIAVVRPRGRRTRSRFLIVRPWLFFSFVTVRVPSLRLHSCGCCCHGQPHCQPTAPRSSVSCAVAVLLRRARRAEGVGHSAKCGPTVHHPAVRVSQHSRVSGCISRLGLPFRSRQPASQSFVVHVAPRKRWWQQCGDVCGASTELAGTLPLDDHHWHSGPLVQRRCAVRISVRPTHPRCTTHACCATEQPRSTDTRAQPQRHPTPLVWLVPSSAAAAALVE